MERWVWHPRPLSFFVLRLIFCFFFVIDHTLVFSFTQRRIISLRVGSFFFVSPVWVCKDNPVTLSTCTSLQLAWLASYDPSHESMLRDLHHVMYFILRDSHHMICITILMLRVLSHVHLRDLHHVIPITCVTSPIWSTSRRWPGSPEWRLLRNYTEVNSWP